MQAGACRRAEESTMMVSDLARTDWLRLIRAEFEELPGLCLTRPQVQRMWGSTARRATPCWSSLSTQDFKQTRDRVYVRVTKGY
jgi:hypothetical protein